MYGVRDESQADPSYVEGIEVVRDYVKKLFRFTVDGYDVTKTADDGTTTCATAMPA